MDNITCGWQGCPQLFGSEIDMNMHVLMNHMILLEHGEFTLNKKVVHRKRPAEQMSHHSPQIRSTPVQIVNPVPEVRTTPSDFRPPPTVITRYPEVPRAPGSMSTTTQKPQLPPPRPSQPLYNERKPDLNEMIRLLCQKSEPDSRSIEGTSSSQERQEPIRPEMEMEADVERKLSEVVDEFVERLKPMKQLGFIRPNRTVYCIVCLKYVRSFHECNWKHSPAEDRVVEMWFRRFGPEKPTGKNQLIGELMEIKAWIQSEEEGNGNRNNNNTL